MTISITYKVADNGTYDRHGRKQALVIESYEGVEAEDRTFLVPGVVVDAFVRARREIAHRVLTAHGHTKTEPEIDWSFLEQGTKQ